VRIGESTFERLPPHLQALFLKLPNYGSEEVVWAFPNAPGQQRPVNGNEPSSPTKNVYGPRGRRPSGFGNVGHDKGDPFPNGAMYTDNGSAARFFYTSKADGDDRLGSKHPTVKPLDLMQYLVRLITPPKGLCLDPFAGTGTTGEAAWREGMSAVLIEREAEYQDDIRRRMKLALSGPDERARESIKQRMNGKPRDDGPLFDFYNADLDFSESINECYRDIRERVANGGPGWGGWPE
jgi:site-specific DNA-methyltransferase (adenine-specific)